jgi:hypothetical protein
LSLISLLSTATPGRWRAFEPVAMMTCLAVSVSPFTSTWKPSAALPANLP